MNSAICMVISFLVFIPFFQANAARPFRGTYEVPVSSDLQAYATYPVKFKLDNYDLDSNLSFPMPATLVGVETQVTLTKDPNNENTWSGPQATGTCEQVDRNFKCRIEFHSLQIDPVLVENAVRTQFTAPDEVAGRLAVAQRFNGEPIGIISYKLRGKNKN